MNSTPTFACMERPSVFTRKDGTAEAVSAMHFCPPVVGHEPVNDPWRKRREMIICVGFVAERGEEDVQVAGGVFHRRASAATLYTSDDIGVELKGVSWS